MQQYLTTTQRKQHNKIEKMNENKLKRSKNNHHNQTQV